MAREAAESRRRRVTRHATALVIAGSDPSGGAGLQADLKTFEAFGVVATGVVTSITAQTATHVRAAEAVAPALVRAQIEAALDTFRPSAVKCGLLGSPANVRVVARCLARVRVPIVVDPVTCASAAGKRLGSPGLLAAIVTELFALGPIVTVNLEEARLLAGIDASDEAGMRACARGIGDLGASAVVVKGGHLGGEIVDILYAHGRLRRFPARREPGTMHGTGCAFASALAAALASGRSLPAAVTAAGTHVRALLSAAIVTRDGGRVRTPLGRTAKPR
jgi:hydroxymethylpyrimidine kinase/phosphomethylpyrimidine kinase